MRWLAAGGYAWSPWKNGGGLTAQIAIWPEDADLDGFAWRISMARIESHGPFSAFPGILRSLTVVSGRGLALELPDGEYRPVPGVPFTFSGDLPVRARLTDGPVTDLNVMSRVGQATHLVRSVQPGPLAAVRPITALFAIGPCVAAGVGGPYSMRQGDMLFADPGERFELVAGGALLVEIDG
ncbi:MAG: HutD family protein [Devosia sp.]|nr:HutD family protein [Devosia sp.]